MSSPSPTDASRKTRRYRQYCGLARALDVVGERWTLLIVRNLLLGPCRYSDLLAHLPGITTNLLAKRLRRMETEGLLEKREGRYALTDRGWALEPVVMALGRWGEGLLTSPSPDDHLDVGWAMVALKRAYRGGHHDVVELHVDDRTFTLTMRDEYLDVREGAVPRGAGALRVVAHQRFAIFGMLRGRVPPPEALDAGAVAYEGTEAQWHSFLRAFGIQSAGPNRAS